MKSNSFWDRISEMKRFCRLWWLVNRLSKDCLKIDADSVRNGEVILRKRGFRGRDTFLGHAALSSVCRFSWVLCWRKRVNKVKYAKRLAVYTEIIDSCILGKTPLILENKENRNEQDEEYTSLRLNPQNELAGDLIGVIPLFQHLLSRYWLVWTAIIIPFAGGVFSSPLIKSVVILVVQRL